MRTITPCRVFALGSQRTQFHQKGSGSNQATGSTTGGVLPVDTVSQKAPTIYTATSRVPVERKLLVESLNPSMNSLESGVWSTIEVQYNCTGVRSTAHSVVSRVLLP